MDSIENWIISPLNDLILGNIDFMDEARILDEVEYALANNMGRVGPYIKGMSREPNPIEIHIGVDTNGDIFSCFLKIEKNKNML